MSGAQLCSTVPRRSLECLSPKVEVDEGPRSRSRRRSNRTSPMHVCCLRLTARSHNAFPPSLVGALCPLDLLSARPQEFQSEIIVDEIIRLSSVGTDGRLPAFKLLYLPGLCFVVPLFLWAQWSMLPEFPGRGKVQPLGFHRLRDCSEGPSRIQSKRRADAGAADRGFANHIE